MQLIDFGVLMSEGQALPGREITPGKKTTPWLDRLMLILWLIIAYEISDGVLNYLKPILGFWSKPFALIGLITGAIIVSEQFLILIEKIRGIR